MQRPAPFSKALLTHNPARRRKCGRANPPELSSRSCDYRKRARRVSRLKRASAPEKKMPNSVIARTWRRQEARSPQRSLMWDAKTLDRIGIAPARAARCVWLRHRRDAHATHWGQLHCVHPGRASPDRRSRLRQRPERAHGVAPRKAHNRAWRAPGKRWLRGPVGRYVGENHDVRADSA